MGRRNKQIKVENLTRFLLYVLGNRPDEFGLVPDDEGFIKVKELLQAFHEEEGWSYVRHSHINEILLGEDRRLFQMEGKSIRVLARRYPPPFEKQASALPALLYTPIRRRAHPVVMEKGLKPSGNGIIVLCREKAMAQRIGRRRDSKPVVLEITGRIAEARGGPFHLFGELFLTSHIPVSCIAGPPVDKELLEPPKKEEQPRPQDFTPGTFVLESRRDPAPGRAQKGKKKKGWKEDSRKVRRKRM